MEWKCFTCEHLNGSNLPECEVCGAIRNLYAEKAFEHKDTIKKLEAQVKILKESLSRTKSERDELVNQLSKKSYVAETFSDIAKDNELKYLKKRELNLQELINSKNIRLSEVDKKLTVLNRSISEKDKIAIENESKLRTKDATIGLLQTSVDQSKAGKKNTYFFIWFLVLVSVCLGGLIYYKQIYLAYEKTALIKKTNDIFLVYLNTLTLNCLKEDIGTRTVIAEDLNNDGELDGIVITSFNGVDCKNNFITNLYVYNARDKFKKPPLKFVLSNSYENGVSFRGFENGKLIFDKWVLKDYDQKKYDPEQIKNSHIRMFINILNDSLNFTSL